jgi:hypothetical protein
MPISTKEQNSNDQLTDCQLLSKDSAAQSQLENREFSYTVQINLRIIHLVSNSEFGSRRF